MKQPIPESAHFTGTKVSIPVSVGGWNTRDPWDSMKKNHAIMIDNLFPRRNTLALRKGYEDFATCGDNPVYSILNYQGLSGSDKLFAITSSGVFDVTSGGVLDEGDAEVVVTDGKWQYAHMTTPGGNFLFCVNGVDKALLYNGSAWVSLDGTSTPAITGADTTTFTNCSIFKNRIILTKKGSLSFYYLPINAIAGAASEFPLGALFNRGGYLVATGSWTLDAGEGADDYFVAITSEGEVAVYKGTDPDSATSFGLVGIYYLGVPIGKRCIIRMAGDLYIITRGGLYPLSKALISASVDRAVAVSDNISEAWKEAVRNYAGNFGWQGFLVSSESLFFVNIPVKVDSGEVTYSYQFVMNTQTGAWCRFSGLNASTWREFAGNLYFGEGNTVRKGWEGYSDNGKSITVLWQTAFNPLNSAAVKRVSLFRVCTRSEANFSLNAGIDIDYRDQSAALSSSSTSTSQALWDVAVWDQASWYGMMYSNVWKSANHFPGGTFSFRLRFSIEGFNVELLTIEAIVEKLASLM